VAPAAAAATAAKAPATDAPPLSAAAKKLWRALRGATQPLGKSDLLERSGLDEAEWRDAIEELRAAGVVEQQGERRGAKYRVVG
jgi:DNA-binding IclR family transcriptional regulator